MSRDTSTVAQQMLRQANRCKRKSYGLYDEISDYSRRASESGSTNVDAETLVRWAKLAKTTNKSITRHLRCVWEQHGRERVEHELLKHAMFADVQDREACFTETLEAIRDTDAAEAVERALRACNALNGAVGMTFDDAVPGDFEGSQVCAQAPQTNKERMRLTFKPTRNDDGDASVSD